MDSDHNSAHFIFANLNGTIAAWDTGQRAFIQVTTPGALYTGLAINQAQTRLYAANGAGAGSINVFDNSFTPVNPVPPHFRPRRGASGFRAVQCAGHQRESVCDLCAAGRTAQTGATPGMGAVAIFDETGVFQQTILRSAARWPRRGVLLWPGRFRSVWRRPTGRQFQFCPQRDQRL